MYAYSQPPWGWYTKGSFLSKPRFISPNHSCHPRDCRYKSALVRIYRELPVVSHHINSHIFAPSHLRIFVQTARERAQRASSVFTFSTSLPAFVSPPSVLHPCASIHCVLYLPHLTFCPLSPTSSISPPRLDPALVSRCCPRAVCPHSTHPRAILNGVSPPRAESIVHFRLDSSKLREKTVAADKSHAPLSLICSIHSTAIHSSTQICQTIPMET